MTKPYQSAVRDPQSALVLVSGIGYSNLSDMSFGRVLLGKLAQMEWPEHVHVEDLNFSPIMILQWFESSPVKYERMVLVNAAGRGRVPGTLEVYRWHGQLPSEADIQARVAEAVTGVIDMENMLIVCKYFGELPAEVTVVEIEPENENWGQEFSPVVAAKVGEALEAVRREALRGEHR